MRRDQILEIRRLNSRAINPADNIAHLLMDVVTAGVQSLGVWRVNVWLIDQDGSGVVRCEVDSEWLNEEPRESVAVETKDNPQYLKHITAGRSVVVNDVLKDSPKAEFLDEYFKPLGITACVDAVILRNNVALGVVSCERKDGAYEWSEEEVMYVELMADCCAKRLLLKQNHSIRQALDEDRELLKLLIKTMPLMVTYKDSEGVFRSCNPRFCEIMGVNSDQVIGKRSFDVFEEERARRVADLDAQTVVLKNGEILKTFVWLKNETTHNEQYMEVLKTPVFINGVPSGLLTIATNLTDWKHAEEENNKLNIRLKKERELITRLLEASPDLFAYKTLEGVFIECNDKYCDFVGLSKKDVVGRNQLDVIAREYHGIIRRNHQEALGLAEGEMVKSCDWIVHVQTKEKLFLEIIQMLTYDDAGNAEGVLTVLHDLTEWKNAQDKLEKLATTDALTNLYNRRYLLDVAVSEINRAKRHGDSVSLIMLDIDFFKRFNDQYGHDAGDEVLKEVAIKLSDELRIIDIFSRHGGEEFLILLPNTPLEKAMEISERLRIILSEIKFNFEGDEEVGVTASFGVAEVDLEADIKESIKYADIAVYEAKESGRNCSRLYKNPLEPS